MKKLLHAIGLLILICFSHLSVAQAPNYQWAKKSGSVNGIGVSAVAVDASGNSYITGVFHTVVSFGGTLLDIGGSGGSYIVKYNTSGAVVWATKVSGGGSVNTSSIAVDASGNVYVAGTFDAPTINFGNYSLNNSSSSGTTYDAFVLKLNSSGNFLWGTKSFSNVTGNDGITAIAIDNSTNFNGYVYVTGYYQDSTTNSRNFIVKRISPTGSGGMAIIAEGTGSESGSSVAVDSSGNIYVTGYFTSPSITLEGIALTCEGSSNTFAFKYDTTTNAVAWAKSATGNNYSYPHGIKIDANGNSYVFGAFNGSSITFDSTSVSNAAGLYATFLVKYDTDGTVVWAKRPNGGNSGSYDGDLSIDADGSCYIAGAFNTSNIVLGSTTLTNAGGVDLFFAKYNSNGTVVWAKAVGGNNSDYSGSIAVNTSGNLYVVGNFLSDSLTLGATTLTNQGNDSWDSEIFLARLDNVTLSVDDFAISDENAMQLYPNPASSEITILNTNQTAISAITFLDVNGRTVKQNTFDNASNILINIADLSRGVYVLKITSNEGITIKKFIKN